MSTTSHQIADNLFLVRQAIGKSGPPPKAVEQQTNHIAIIDCSGSMSGDLPQVRNHLKNKLATLLGPQDTVTLIWFSGKGQFSTLVEAAPVAGLTDLQAIHKAIDRWLQPIGLTGFKEPLEEASKVVDRVGGKTGGGVFNLFFMSDGCDNQWGRADILKAVEGIASKCAASTFVEYGYYADRALLASMAERAGGAHVFAEDFPSYEPVFSAVMQKKPVGGKRIEVKISGDAIGGFVYAMDGTDLLTFAIEGGKALVHEHVTDLAYLSPQKVGQVGDDLNSMARQNQPPLSQAFSGPLSAAYGALSLYAVRMKPEVIYPILKALGDVSFIEQFSGCFGKQKYSAFMDAAKGAAFKSGERFVKGRDPSKVPDDNAFTVLHLLEILNTDESARVMFDHPEWRYSRISRSRVDANDNLTFAEREKLAELTEALGTTKHAAKLREIQTEIDKILAAKKTALKFTAKPEPNGYPISSLTYNEESPNISILVRKEGTIDLAHHIAETAGKVEGLDKLPANFPSFIYRNYAIVKHGLVNVDKLVLKISDDTKAALAKNGVDMLDSNGVTIVNLKPLPIINRSMVKAASAKKLFDLEWRLTELRSAQKVFNTYRKELFPKESKGYKLVYGESAATWLQEQGITDYNGFSPRMVQADSKDFYMGKQLDVKLKGYASIPSLKEAKASIAKKTGKGLTGCTELMASSIEEVEKFLTDNASAKPLIREQFLEGMQKATTAKTRALILQKARQLFAVIVGQVWFEEWSTLDENTLTVEPRKGLAIKGTVEMKEIQIDL